MKKVLFVINTLGRAGAERTLMALLNEFDKEKYDVSLLSVIPRGECFSEVPDGVKILNKKYSTGSVMSSGGMFMIALFALKSIFVNFLRIINIPKIIRYMTLQIKNKRRSFSKIFWLPISLSVAERNEYDLAVAFLEGASTYYVSERVKAKKKVTFIHNDYKKSGYLKNTDRQYYKKYDKIYCVSESARVVAELEFPEFSDKIETFQNVISDSFVKNMARMGEGYDDLFDGVRLLTVARLHEQKGYKNTIRAFKRLLEHKELNVRWYVIGEGPERHQLIKLVKELELEQHFIFMGKKSNTYPYIDQCDIYVHCTNYEGWSIAIAEAKILSKPILVSDTTNADKQLPPGTFKMTKNNEYDIAEALYELISDIGEQERIKKESSKEWKRPNDIPKLYEFLEN